MAIAHGNVTYWDPLTKPDVGSIYVDNYSMQVKVFDGKDWITMADPVNMELSDLQQLLRDRENLSDSWLETKYEDLKQMREQHEKEYKTLSEKYRVFEILRMSGE